MKIAHFIYDSHSNPWLGGGGVHRVYEIYTRFDPFWSIDIFHGNFSGAPDPHSKENISVRYLGKETKNYAASRFWYVHTAKKAARDLSKEYDLIIEDFSPYSPLGTPRLVPPQQVIGQFQNFFGLRTHVRKFGIIGLLFNRIETRSIVRFKNAIFTSEDLRETIQTSILRLELKHSAVIHNGVDDELFQSGPQQQTEFQSDYILYLGRLEIEQKGIDVVLKVFSQLHKEFPHVRLIIAGGGKDKGKIETMISSLDISSHIELTGRVTGTTKRRLLSGALFTLMPSRFESWGIVSLESQACGTPVIAANIPGLRQTVISEKTGFLATTFQDFVSFSRLLLLNRPLRDSMGSEGRIVARNFSWQSAAVKQQNFYADINTTRST